MSIFLSKNNEDESFLKECKESVHRKKSSKDDKKSMLSEESKAQVKAMVKKQSSLRREKSAPSAISNYEYEYVTNVSPISVTSIRMLVWTNDEMMKSDEKQQKQMSNLSNEVESSEKNH